MVRYGLLFNVSLKLTIMCYGNYYFGMNLIWWFVWILLLV